MHAAAAALLVCTVAHMPCDSVQPRLLGLNSDFCAQAAHYAERVQRSSSSWQPLYSADCCTVCCDVLCCGLQEVTVRVQALSIITPLSKPGLASFCSFEPTAQTHKHLTCVVQCTDVRRLYRDVC